MKLSARRTGNGLYSIAAGVVLLLFSTHVAAQAPAVTSTVPTLINFSGTLSDTNGKPLTDVTGVTFLLYKDSEGGAPLWIETQNVRPDKTGHCSVVLGSATSQGLPQDVFASREARWLAVQIAGQEEQPRVLLVAVPYALKAGDAETIGGLPPSAFVLANGTPGIRSNGSASISLAPASTKTAASANPEVTGKGMVVMKAHPYVVEQDKPEGERGYYTEPELYGAPKEQGIRWPRQPAAKKPRIRG
jgi:hypothetical protein